MCHSILIVLFEFESDFLFCLQVELDTKPAHSFGIRHSPHVGQLKPIPALTYTQNQIHEDVRIENVSLNDLKNVSNNSHIEDHRHAETRVTQTSTLVEKPATETTVVRQNMQNGNDSSYTQTITRTEGAPSSSETKVTRITKSVPQQAQNTSSTTVTRVIQNGEPRTSVVQNGSSTRIVETTKNGVTTRVVETTPLGGKTTRTVETVPGGGQVIRTQTTYTSQPVQTTRTQTTKTQVHGQTKVQAAQSQSQSRTHSQKMICT